MNNEELRMKNEELWQTFCFGKKSLLNLKMDVVSLGRDVVLNALRLNNNFTKMQIRASKLARKHFYSLLHLEPCPRRAMASGSPKLY
ncbi:MAG: hypothetical protein IJO25_00790 [Clostridia bacterium]|nr:hypothetical protein [Clostridia bacterium]